MKIRPYVRNFLILAAATLAMPLLQCGLIGALWPYSFEHLRTRMLPLALSTLFFLAMANILTYCDVEDEVNRNCGYILNLVAIGFPVMSFAYHSNLPVLDDWKVLYEYGTAVTNIVVSLLAAEFCRRYTMRYEEKHRQALSSKE